MKLKVLIVDDSSIYRQILTQVMESLPDVEVVGIASNGWIALQKVRDLRPDLVTLDMEMPGMSGMEVLAELQRAGTRTAVIVVSVLTRRGGRLTMQALEKGAFDFVTKPEATGSDANREVLRAELAPRLRALAHRLEVRNILRAETAIEPPKKKTAPNAPPVSDVERQRPAARLEVVLIGVSTGGPNALAHILPQIPADIGVPILIVQHMPAVFTQSLAESLAAKCVLQIKEADHGEAIRPNIVYIAPGGQHMGVSTDRTIRITDDPPENNCRPAVDYLFRSVATHFSGQVLAVILTGMGSDGTLGLRRLKRHGCYVIAQDEASCVVYGMPKAVVDAGLSDAVISLNNIAAQITATVRKRNC